MSLLVAFCCCGKCFMVCL